MKEMALAGRPEPHGQRKCLWVAGQSLAGLPSDRMPHRELPDLDAEHFSNPYSATKTGVWSISVALSLVAVKQAEF